LYERLIRPSGGIAVQVTLTVSGAASCAGGNLRNVEIGATPFSIGRSEACGLSVQDDQGAISRLHCELREQDGKLVLTDFSSNGTFVQTRGNRLVHGQPTPLPDSVVIYVGGADIEVQAARADGVFGAAKSRSLGEEDLFGAAPSRTDATANPFGGGAADPFGVAGGGVGGAFGAAPEPMFAAPAKPAEGSWDRHAPTDTSMHFSPSNARPAPKPAAPDPFAAPVAPKPAAKPASGLPDDWIGGDTDPFADMERQFSGFGGSEPTPAQTPGQTPPAQMPASDPFGDDDPFGGGDPFAPDPPPAAAPPMAAPPRAAPQPAPTPANTPFGAADDDPFADFAPAPVAASAPAPAHAPVAAAPAPAPQQTPAPQQAPAPQAAAEDAALTALFNATGARPAVDTPEARAAFAAEIGRQHRAMADALRRLLLMRRDAKMAFGVRQTQVEMGMNPLKWAPDANAAVDALLGPDTGSFKRGQAAIDDAVQSLEAHQMAMIGAVKAGLKVSIAAFDPAALEKKLASRGLSSIIPQLRRAELWEKFRENYTDFAEDVDEDIVRVLGRELDRLYGGGGRP
jgi:type VI secretion system FHA domain protein